MNPPTDSAIDLENLSKRFVRGFDQVKQFAAEKIGNTSSVTPYPDEYLRLEERLEGSKQLFDGLLRVGRQLISSDDYSPPIGDSIRSAVDRLYTNTSDKEKKTSEVKQQGGSGGIGCAMTIQQAASVICTEGAASIEAGGYKDSKIKDCFENFGAVMQRIGQARMTFNANATRLFLEPFETYAGSYEMATRARRQAQGVRLELDAMKSRLQKEASNEELKSEVDALTLKFKVTCDDAVQEMLAFLQFTEAAHCLQALMTTLSDYHSQVASILKE